MFKMVVIEEVEECQTCKVCEKAWRLKDHEGKVLYEMMAHIINKINEYEGKETNFKGFNIWMYNCQRERQRLEEILGVI